VDVSLDGQIQQTMMHSCFPVVLQSRSAWTIDKAVQFVTSFFDAGKPVAAICHGWTLIEAKVVEGRTLTSWPSSKQIFKMQELTGLIRSCCRQRVGN